MSDTFEGLEIIEAQEAKDRLEHKRRQIDPRGLLFTWEAPSSRETYYLGVDPTRGVTGWTRNLRLQQDKAIDNGVVEVLKLGRNGAPDVQVAEYAAPVDTIDLACIATKIGRLYSGNAERGCLAIVETTGVGITTQEEMLRKYHYHNMYVWEKLGGVQGVQRTSVYGWQATKDSNLALWVKCHRHLDKGRVIVNSPWLVDEMADATMDWTTQTVRAKWSKHDDRLRAFFLTLWAAHSWSYEEPEAVGVQADGRPINYVASDYTVEEMSEALDEAFGATFLRDR